MIYSDQINSIQSLGKKELYERPIQPEFIVKKIALTMLSFSLLLSMGISVNLEEASAQNRSIPNDMQAIKRDIGESLSRLTSTNSSNLLSKTIY